MIRWLVAALLTAAAIAVHGASAHAELEASLRCPVCDYTVGYLVRTLAKQHRKCQNVSSLASLEKDEFALRCDESRRTLLYDYTLQRLVHACEDDVLESFPAIEAAIPQDVDPSDSDGLERQRRVTEQASVNPLEKQFHSALQRICLQELPKKHHGPMSKGLHSTITATLRGFPPESDGAERRDVYTAVLKAQRQFCGKACGEDLRRPEKPQDAAAKASFNAYGRRIRYHE
jgi:hypothetical protein